MRRSIVIALLLVVAWPGSAALARDTRNAFTWYSKAIELMAKIPKDRLDAVLNYYGDLRDDPTVEIPADVAATLRQLQPALERVQRGSQQEFSDTGLDFSQDLHMRLPHVQRMRELAKIAGLDAEVRLRAGDAAGTADRVAMMYRMADHFTHDRVIISSLVAQAISTMADQTIDNGFDRGVLRPEDAAAILNAVKSLPSNDPFSAVEAIMSEQEMIVSWLERLRPTEDEADGIHDKLLNVLPPEDAARFEGMTSEQLDEEILAVDDMMSAVVQVFMLPDKEQAKAEIAALETALQAGEFGVLGRRLMTAYSKVLDMKFRGQEQLAERVRMLEGIAAGQASPAELVNAALWYLRAIEMLRKLPPGAWALIHTAAENPAAPVDESLSEAIAVAAPIIEVLREGSEKRRCDFRPGRLGLPTIVRPYVAGMRDLVRVLHADAVRCEHAGDLDGLTDRLAIAFRMSAHLSGDGALLSALTAHRIFSVTADLTPLNPRLHQLSEPQRATLLAAVDVMSRKDPFGYLEAAATDRKQVDAWLRPLMPGGVAGAAPIAPGQPGELDPTAAASALTQSLQGDRLLFMLVLHDSLRIMPSAAAVDANAADASEQRFIESLDDMIDAETWRATRQRGSELRRRMDEEPQWPAQAFAVITSLPTAVIAPLAEPMRAARGDLRRMAVALQPLRGERKPSAEPAPALEPVTTPP